MPTQAAGRRRQEPHATHRGDRAPRAGDHAHRPRLARDARRHPRRLLRDARRRSTRSATSRVPDPTLITIQPWDPSLLPAIEKAIRTSDLDLNPQNDGKIIRIPIPSLTEERRKNLVKHAHKHAEEGRVADPQRAPRRQRAPEEAAQGPRGQRGRREARPRRGPEAHRPAHRGDQRDPEEEGSGDHGGLTPLAAALAAVRVRLSVPPARSLACLRSSAPRLHRGPRSPSTITHRRSTPTAPAPGASSTGSSASTPTKGDARVEIRPDEDPLRLLHRFPAGEPWRSATRRRRGLHVVVARGHSCPLPTPSTATTGAPRAPRAPPARNHRLRLRRRRARTSYEYRRPSSTPPPPSRGAGALPRRARSATTPSPTASRPPSPDGAAPREPTCARAYREQLAEPFAREVALLAARPALRAARAARARRALRPPRRARRRTSPPGSRPSPRAIRPRTIEAAVEASVEALGDELLARARGGRAPAPRSATGGRRASTSAPPS